MNFYIWNIEKEKGYIDDIEIEMYGFKR